MGNKERAEKLKAKRAHRMGQLFQDRFYRIVREFNLDPLADDLVSPLGYKLRRGYVLEEVGNPENTLYVGIDTLRAIAEEYNAVTLPPKKPIGRPRKSAIEGEQRELPEIELKFSDLFLA